MTWQTFHCDSPDFYVRSVPDETTFAVERARLEERSEVFRDMFSCCDLGSAVNMTDGQEQCMDLDEPAPMLSVLLRLLHMPLMDYIQEHSEPKFHTELPVIMPDSAIPLPLLPGLFGLVDKYVLVPTITRVLQSHLAAYMSTFPLKVYSYALQLDMPTLAGKASRYLLHPPMHTYTVDDVRVIPSVEAYHQLVRLQNLRKTLLCEVLLAEAVFPFGYKECPTVMHTRQTTALWAKRKNDLVGKIDAGTDVAGEMREILEDVKSCKTCTAACTAAVAMLEYKCRKVIRRVDQLPSD